MTQKFTRPRGTQDVLPAESWKWQFVEEKMRNLAYLYGYGEIRVPTFESTDVFSRGVGEETDIVSKEMYTFEDKGGRSITLRPEITAGAVRAVLENGLLANSPLPLKSYYIQSCFRYERAQKGRLREFHQFGIECYGTHEAQADVEVMALAEQLFRSLGLRKLIHLEINSIGCPACRPAYHQALRDYFSAHSKKLCGTCLDRLQNNPMRLLDCKEAECQVIAKDAPVILDYICDDCHNHFEQVQADAAAIGLPFTVNPRIVRGLDYYTNTVFEFIAEGIGTQGTVCGGGRYDGLIEQMGGQPAPAVGFGMGIERLLMLLEENGKLPAPPIGPALFAVGATDAGRTVCRKLTAALRGEGVAAECDLAARSVKAQMKAAGRLGALYATVVGDEEAKSGIATLKRMADGSEAELPLVGFVSILKYIIRQDPLAESAADLEPLIRAAGPAVSFETAADID